MSQIRINHIIASFPLALCKLQVYFVMNIELTAFKKTFSEIFKHLNILKARLCKGKELA